MVDLLEGDKAKELVDVQAEEIAQLKEISSLKDSLVILRDNEIDRLNKIKDIVDIENQGKTQEIERLNRELHRQMTYKTVFMTTTGVTAIALIISLLIK